jgi:hypothetical protein
MFEVVHRFLHAAFHPRADVCVPDLLALGAAPEASVSRLSSSVNVSVFTAFCLGHTLEDLGRDDALVRDYLAVLAVEGDLEPSAGGHDVTPPATDPQIYVGDGDLARSPLRQRMMSSGVVLAL